MATREDIQEIYNELVKIRRLLEFLSSDRLRSLLEGIASTEERRQIWRLCDGTRSTGDVAEEVGISQRAVQIFLSELQEKDLITFHRRGYPVRLFNYVPENW